MASQGPKLEKLHTSISLLDTFSVQDVVNVVSLGMLESSDNLALALRSQCLESLALKYNTSERDIQSACSTLHSFLQGFLSLKTSESPENSIDSLRSYLLMLGMKNECVSAISNLVESVSSSPVDSTPNNSSQPPRLHITSQLIDMQWKFGVTAASSELDSVGTTFLQMKLLIRNQEGEAENVYMELSLSQFYDFLHELKKAQMHIDSTLA